MTIQIRNGNEKWKTLHRNPYSDESQLQKLLYDSPELIPTQDEEVAVFIREAGLPGSGSTDLLGVDSQGNILVVETKLAKNQEVRRKVVGQILEYAAFLWRMPFDDFNEIFVRRRGKSLLELLVEKKPQILTELVRDAVKRNLNHGKFQLLIAVDQINDELERIITYFAECGGGIQLEALELELYIDGTTQILVPKRYGNELNSHVEGAKLLTLPQVLERAEGVSRVRLQQLVDLWHGLGNRIEPGTQGASFKAEINSRLHPIFWAYPTSLQAAFSELAKRGTPGDEIDKLRRVVATFNGFDQIKAMNGAQPMAKLSDFSEEEIRKFIDASQDLVQAWRRSSSTGEKLEVK